jgi:hypothetical protein
MIFVTESGGNSTNYCHLVRGQFVHKLDYEDISVKLIGNKDVSFLLKFLDMLPPEMTTIC